MDFNRNPVAIPGDAPFSLERLDQDVHHYLKTAGASQELPIDRLRHMNPLAIELYKRYKVDITTNPLEFAVNNQHMNGGISVDIWGRTNVSGIYAIGEAAGTHGATRPGGSALNAGQVFGTRVAEHITAQNQSAKPSDDVGEERAVAAISAIMAVLNPDSPLSAQHVRQQVQARMSDQAGILCTPDGVSQALEQAKQLNSEIRAHGMSLARPGEAARVLQWQQMALVSEAVLTALNSYICNGGGSRGARAICDPKGDALPLSANGELSDVRFRSERDSDKDEQICVRLEGACMVLKTRENRVFDERDKTFFERDWPAWLTGLIYDNVAADVKRSPGPDDQLT